MRSGLRRGAAFVGLALAFVAALAATSRGAAGPFSFPHRPHLSAATIAAGADGTGSDADCRACHDYAKGDRESHLTGCDKCHVDAAHLETKKSGAYTRPAFQHREHLFAKDGSPRRDVSCFSCHSMHVDYDFIEFTVPTSGLGPKSRGGKTDAKTCADCHAAHDTKSVEVPQFQKTGDGKACALCHLKETSILPLKYRGDARPLVAKPFVHGDHGGATSDCASCHEGIKKSKTIWDYDATAGTAEKCAACHVDAAGKSLAAAGPTTSVTRIDFSNFPHEKHFGEFSKMNCRTCHYPETDDLGRTSFPQRVASPEPVARAQLLRFAACDTCHGHDGWMPQKPSWHVENHGVGAWACFKCHEGKADADGKLAIASAQVDRTSIVALKILMHAHPGVTALGTPLTDATQTVAGVAKSCRDCHLADVTALVSSIQDKAFAHDPHVAPTRSVGDCTSCHHASATSRRSEDMDRFDWAQGVEQASGAMSGTGCFACHGRAGDYFMISTGRPGAKTPQFDHAGHVRAASLVPGEKGIACSECHVADGKLGYSTPADVLNCTKCHAHEGDAAKIARTGPKASKGDAASCLHCHETVRGEESDRLGAPERETVKRSHLELSNGKQFHDKAGDCASCHVRDGATSAPYEERIRSAKVSLSIHEDPKFAGKPFNDPKGKCDECHRVAPRGYLRSLGQR